MKRGKYEAPRAPKRHSSKKALAMLLSLVLVIGCVAGGTLAWLTATSNEVNNVFIKSDIGVKLEEKETEFKMIPGWTIDKSPRVTVTANSEDCWLFVEVTESTNLELGKYIKYAVNTNSSTTNTDNVTHGGWTQGTGTGEGGDGVPTNVYYRKVTKATSDQVFAVLGNGTYEFNSESYSWTNDEVLTKPEVTKEMMAEVTTKNQPKLSFTAYASQLYKNNTTEFTAGQVWNNVKPATP